MHENLILIFVLANVPTAILTSVITYKSDNGENVRVPRFKIMKDAILPSLVVIGFIMWTGGDLLFFKIANVPQAVGLGILTGVFVKPLSERIGQHIIGFFDYSVAMYAKQRNIPYDDKYKEKGNEVPKDNNKNNTG